MSLLVLLWSQRMSSPVSSGLVSAVLSVPVGTLTIGALLISCVSLGWSHCPLHWAFNEYLPHFMCTFMSVNWLPCRPSLLGHLTGSTLPCVCVYALFKKYFTFTILGLQRKEDKHACCLELVIKEPQTTWTFGSFYVELLLFCCWAWTTLPKAVSLLHCLSSEYTNKLIFPILMHLHNVSIFALIFLLGSLLPH